MGLHNDLLKRNENDIAMDDIENIDLPFTTIIGMITERGYKIHPQEVTELQKLFDRMRKLAQYNQQTTKKEEIKQVLQQKIISKEDKKKYWANKRLALINKMENKE